MIAVIIYQIVYTIGMALVQKVRESIKKKISPDYGGLTKKEVKALEKLNSGKAKIVTCEDSEDFFKKMGIEE
jgi:hypothetical protein